MVGRLHFECWSRGASSEKGWSVQIVGKGMAVAVSPSALKSKCVSGCWGVWVCGNTKSKVGYCAVWMSWVKVGRNQHFSVDVAQCRTVTQG